MKATIILPTTADRGALLKYSADSALRQIVREIELFVVGDGVNDETRNAVEKLMEKDSRVSFFDFDKHPRRGEPYRHQVLRDEASGEIVCYLCDRDLMLSNHVAEIYQQLKTHDIASTLNYWVQPDGTIFIVRVESLSELTGENRQIRHLSSVGHTLQAYKSLPYGWRTTPLEEQYTDIYMWNQFLEIKETRASIIPVPTILYFNRGDHPGLPTPQRAKELETWYGKLIAEDGESKIHRECLCHIIRKNFELADQVDAQRQVLQKWITIRRKPPRLFLQKVLQKILRG